MDPSDLRAGPDDDAGAQPPPPASVTPDADEAWLRRITLTGIGLPLAFVGTIAALRPRLLERLWPGHAHLLLDLVTLLAVVVFGVTMAAAIRRGHALLLSRTRALDALEHARVLERARHAATLGERDRIAREMHDSLAQVLGVAHLRLRVLAEHPAIPPDQTVRQEVTAVAELCHEAYRDVREAILGLRATPREERGLLDALGTYVASYSRQSSIPTRLESSVSDDPQLSPPCEVQVIRIVQEALTNVRKHSGAASAVVRVSLTNDEVLFDVEDDGRGFDPRGATGADGFGLRSMQERSQLAGGRLTIDATPGAGTRVRLAVPRRCDTGPVTDPAVPAAQPGGQQAVAGDAGRRAARTRMVGA